MMYIFKTVLSIIIAWAIITFVIPPLLIFIAIAAANIGTKNIENTKPLKHIEKDAGFGK